MERAKMIAKMMEEIAEGYEVVIQFDDRESAERWINGICKLLIDLSGCFSSAVLRRHGLSVGTMVDTARRIREVSQIRPFWRQAAELWAGAVHLSASDNDEVEVPPEPEHVRASAKRVELNWP